MINGCNYPAGLAFDRPHNRYLYRPKPLIPEVFGDNQWSAITYFGQGPRRIIITLLNMNDSLTV